MRIDGWHQARCVGRVPVRRRQPCDRPRRRRSPPPSPPEVPDRPDLDRAVPGGRDPRRELDRLVEVAGLDEVEAAEGLLGLGERAVGRDRLAVLDPDRRRARGRLERLAGLEQPASSRTSAVNALYAGELVAISSSDGRRAGLRRVDQEQVAHAMPPWLRGRTAAACPRRRTRRPRIDRITPCRVMGSAEIRPALIGQLAAPAARPPRRPRAEAVVGIDRRDRSAASPCSKHASRSGSIGSRIARCFAGVGRPNRISSRVPPAASGSNRYVLTIGGTPGIGSCERYVK